MAQPKSAPSNPEDVEEESTRELILQLRAQVKKLELKVDDLEKTVKEQSKRVHFQAYVLWTDPKSKNELKTVTYDGLDTHSSDCGMDKNTGTFTAKQPGIYFFNFQATTKGGDCVVYIRHKTGENEWQDRRVARGRSQGPLASQDTPITVSAVLTVSVGDTVRIELKGDLLRTSSDRCIQFQGFQISQEYSGPMTGSGPFTWHEQEGGSVITGDDDRARRFLAASNIQIVGDFKPLYAIEVGENERYEVRLPQ